MTVTRRSHSSQHCLLSLPAHSYASSRIFVSPEWFELGTVEALDSKDYACRFRDSQIEVEQQLEGEKMCEHIDIPCLLPHLVDARSSYRANDSQSVSIFTFDFRDGFIADRHTVLFRATKIRYEAIHKLLRCQNDSCNIEHVSAGGFPRQSHEIDPVFDLGDTHIIYSVTNESYHLLHRGRRRIFDLKTNRPTRFRSIDVTHVDQLSTLFSSLRCARQDSKSRTVFLPLGLLKNVS